jgi:hypothetical protein
MKRILVLFISILVTSAGFTQQSKAQSVSKAGITAAEFLKIPVGARSTAMGGATTAISNDLTSMFWNPSGLADVTTPSAYAEYGDWFIDVNHNYFGFAMPVGNGVLGANVTALTMGDFEETTYDNPEGTGRTFNAYSMAVGVTYAQYLLDVFQIGANVKYVSENISFSSASGIAFDIGTIYKTPFDDIKFGVSITNVGEKMTIDGEDLITTTDLADNQQGNYEPDVKLKTDPYDMPMQLKVGVAWDPYVSEDFRATITVDGNNPSNNVQSISVGTEIGFMNNLVMLRAGLPELGLKDRVQEFAAGMGVKYSLNSSMGIEFDFSYQQYKYLGGVNRISLGLNF